MYCGDEIGALVAEVGTASCRFGWAGEDLPKALVPPLEGVLSLDGAMPRLLYGDAALRLPQAQLELRSCLGDGVVTDLDACSRLWDYIYREVLPSTAAELPLLLAAPAHEPAEVRLDLTERLFEERGVPALYVARSSVLACFAAGRATACVVDLSASGMTVGPVVDGFQLNRGVRRTAHGGNFLDSLVATHLASPIHPRFAVARTALTAAAPRREVIQVPCTESFRRHWTADVARDLRESLCRVPPTRLEPRETSPPSEHPRGYELPDGAPVDPPPALQTLPDVLFSPSGDKGEIVDSIIVPLPNLVRDGVAACDLDCRKELLLNVVVCGGLSLTPGVPERLGYEVTRQLPSAFKVKVTAATSVERRFSSWIGGSILASLGNFQKLWLSKSEYDELGGALADERFRC